MTLTVGDILPDFKTLLPNGSELSKTDILGKVSVFFFYPKDNTRHCTAEVCEFRDNYSEFKKLGAEVYGISPDSEGSHSDFSTKHNLQYTLISDKIGSLAKTFGVPKHLGFIQGRVTFVIDKNGIIQSRYQEFFANKSHLESALEKVKELAK